MKKYLITFFIFTLSLFSQTTGLDRVQADKSRLEQDHEEKLILQKQKAAEEFQAMLKLLVNPDGTMRTDAGKILLESKFMEKMVTLNQKMLQGLPRDTVKDIFREKLAMRNQAKLIDEYPNVANFAIELLQHETMLINFIRGFKSFDKFKVYVAILIFLFIIRFFINKKLRKKNYFILRRLFNWILITAVITGLNFVSMYFIYQEELDPIIGLWQKHFT